MDRKPITAGVVEEIERLLAQGIGHGTIAACMSVTEYIVEVIAGDEMGRGREQPKQISSVAVPRFYRYVDAATIRMIQRMLAVGMLSRPQIAHEAGVSPQLVEKVLKGKRLPVSAQRPYVFKDLGEKFLEKPIQCDECEAMIEIVPCRACRARRQ
jgi:hypothetical protein